MSFIKLFIESTKPKFHAQKNLFYFLLGYFVSVFYYWHFNPFKLLLGTLIFITTYSCVYVVNDLFDYKKDKLHPLKKTRPIASGRLNPTHALMFTGFIYITGFVSSLLLINPLFSVCLLLMIFGNFAYSHPLFKTKKSTIPAALIIALLQYAKLLAGWSLNAGELGHPVVYFMIPACLYVYSTLQLIINSDHYKGRFKIKTREFIAGKVLMIAPAVLITVLLFTELVLYVAFTLLPVYLAFLYVARKLKEHDCLFKFNKYMTYLNSLMVTLNMTFLLSFISL